MVLKEKYFISEATPAEKKKLEEKTENVKCLGIRLDPGANVEAAHQEEYPVHTEKPTADAG